MKHFYSLLLSFAMVGSSLPAGAQQLDNNGFEGSWSTCTPWTAGNGSKTAGMNPANWCISHVMGVTSGMFAGTGAKAMGEEVSGNNSAKAVKVYNDETGALGITRVVPGYLTTGTTWSTANGTNAATHDGGTWGGINFSSRPDAIEFLYKREYASASAATEPCSFVAYIWKGSASQANVPVTITTSGSPKTTTMTNRERNILFKGESTTTGGAVTYSNDFALIARINTTETGTVANWTKKTLEFEYLTQDQPTMFNVIFAANDYFNTAAATKGNSLYIDDVKLLYYSRLASLSVNGAAIAGFSSDTYSYTIDAELPSADAFAYTLVGNSGSANVNVSLNKATAVATIKVSNVGVDADGETSHTYTLQFNKSAGSTDEYPGTKFDGAVVITMGESVLESDGVVYINTVSEGVCTMMLPNFSIDLMGDGEMTNLGDIFVENINVSGTTEKTYSTSTPTRLALAEGEILADVTLEGTESGNSIRMLIHVKWVDEEGNEIMPIEVTFNGDRELAGIEDVTMDNENAPVFFYNIQGMPVQNGSLAPGLYIRRQGTDVQKIYVR